jgi:transcriptional regulator with XRE-family HTH domain
VVRVTRGLVEECRDAAAGQVPLSTHSPQLLNAAEGPEVRVINRDQGGYARITTANEIPGVQAYLNAGAVLGDLWMEGYLTPDWQRNRSAGDRPEDAPTACRPWLSRDETASSGSVTGWNAERRCAGEKSGWARFLFWGSDRSENRYSWVTLRVPDGHPEVDVGTKIDPRWWDQGFLDGQPVRDILAERDIGRLFRFLNRRGFSRAAIAALTGVSETRVRQIWSSRQQVSSYDVLERIAGGLHIPRGYLGLAYAGDDHQSASDDAEGQPSGLIWHPDLRETVETVCALWNADASRRKALHQSTWVAAALAPPTRDWLLDLLDDETTAAGDRPVNQADVRVVWTMCDAFTEADHRLGGGHARIALGHYVTASVLPLIRGGYSEPVGRELLSATARLCDLGGFMAFDSGLQGLGLRYYIQALRLAQAGRNRMLGAHILADMSMQANHVDDPREAAALAVAGIHSARTTGSGATVARCEAMYARALAKSGDRHGCELAMSRAETALGRARVEDEPAWTSFFTRDQLDTEFVYAAADLGLRERVRSLAPGVITSSGHMERRKVLLSATLAKACLPASEGLGFQGCEVEQACAVLVEVAPLLSSLTTERGRRAVGAVRGQLSRHARLSAVRQLDDLLGTRRGDVV